eukprot:CAMPEP_0197678362 /NCGR_PEP_ID=MMETSP1338-20131121/89906_1 /TAXON_ID=43686 ORGANISM="Pelagodinium beii, Strain RCC1491" /NCGR_SAMPLE_ID=MMETSP1338 /ASSEMBLY_ACC=CAM_ASM_000754 /LENGTH=149 /DNA_ID=CAMNT_0043259295 /DNA_START=1 /DNA_END=451 /DNA_ORIENTATION=+
MIVGVCLASILAPLDQLVVTCSVAKTWNIAARPSAVQEVATIVNQHEAREVGRAPHQLEGDARAELNMSNILRRICMATIRTCAPGATRSKLWKAGCLDSRAQQIPDSNVSNCTIVLVVSYISKHGCQITMVVVVERMASVATSRLRIW